MKNIWIDEQAGYLEDQLNVQDIYEHSKLQDEKISNFSEILTSCGDCY